MNRLEVPGQPARLELHRERRVREQVHSRPCRPVVVGRRIPGVEVDEAELRVNRRRCPHSGASLLAVTPTVLGNLPALVPRPLGDGVEDPLDRPGGRIGGDHQTAADVALRIPRARVQRVVTIGGRRRQAIPQAVGVHPWRVDVRVLEPQRLGHDLVPPTVAKRLHQFPGLAVDRVHGGAAEGVDPAAAVDGTASTGLQRLTQSRRPDPLAACGVDREQGRPRVEIHDAIHHQGRDLHDAVRRARFERPGQLETRDVRRVDLVDVRIAAAANVQVVQRPVGLAAGGDPGWRGVLRRGRRRLGADCHGRQDREHGASGDGRGRCSAPSDVTDCFHRRSPPPTPDDLVTRHSLVSLTVRP